MILNSNPESTEGILRLWSDEGCGTRVGLTRT